MKDIYMLAPQLLNTFPVNLFITTIVSVGMAEYFLMLN